MFALMNWRVWAAIALAAALAFTHFTAYRAGKAAVQAKWTAEKLELSEAARAREQVLVTKTQEVDRAYQAEKKRRAAADAVAAGRLLDLHAALANTNASGSSGANDPRDTIIRECTSALVTLDKDASRLAGKVSGLQDFAEVCVTPPK